jgi:putative transposase
MNRYDPDKHHRRSIRLRGFDYARPGAYFVTICTQDRQCLFGEIRDGQAIVNEIGRMIQATWDEMPHHYPGVQIDAFVVMPNHIHGIVMLTDVGATPCGCPDSYHGPDRSGQAQGPAPTMSLSDVVHRFKSMTTSRYRHKVLQGTWPPFRHRLWQRNYYEHIIRDEDELNQIRTYISENPLRWELDENHPSRLTAPDQDQTIKL